MTQEGGASGQMDIDEINQLIELHLNFQPDEPIYVQYIDYMSGAILEADFGVSIWQNEPVINIFARALPWTILLGSVTLLVTFGFGTLLGSAMAYYEGSRFDFGSTFVSLLLTSIPYYVVALFLLAIFGYQLEWFPTAGRVGSDVPAGLNIYYMSSIIHHASLPLISLILTGFGGVALAMRGNCIQLIGNDYIRVGQLRGLPEKAIVTKYITRNGMLPLYTSFMMRLGTVFGGAIILEAIFTYPGVGWYMYRAFEVNDYPLLMGGFIVVTFVVILGVYIADLTYSMIDPRVKGGGEREGF